MSENTETSQEEIARNAALQAELSAQMLTAQVVQNAAEQIQESEAAIDEVVSTVEQVEDENTWLRNQMQQLISQMQNLETSLSLIQEELKTLQAPQPVETEVTEEVSNVAVEEPVKKSSETTQAVEEVKFEGGRHRKRKLKRI